MLRSRRRSTPTDTSSTASMKPPPNASMRPGVGFAWTHCGPGANAAGSIRWLHSQIPPREHEGIVRWAHLNFKPGTSSLSGMIKGSCWCP